MWQENWPAVLFFSRLSTQWRTGIGCQSGLDYTAVLALLRTLRLPRTEFDALFEDVQVMEGEALREMARQSKQKC